MELEIKRIKRDAETLKPVDPAAAFTTLGIVACFEGKTSDMHQFHRNALAYSGGNDPVHLATTPFHFTYADYRKKLCDMQKRLMR